jgi:hypothetical protein
MSRGTRLKILLGASIIGIIGVVTHSNILIGCAVFLLLLSCLRYRASPPTNYTEKFGPAEPSGAPSENVATPFTEARDREDREPES